MSLPHSILREDLKLRLRALAHTLHTISWQTKWIPVIVHRRVVVLVDGRIDRAILHGRSVDTSIANGTAHAVSPVDGITVDVCWYIVIVVHTGSRHAIVTVVVMVVVMVMIVYTISIDRNR